MVKWNMSNEPAPREPVPYEPGESGRLSYGLKIEPPEQSDHQDKPVKRAGQSLLDRRHLRKAAD